MFNNSKNQTPRQSHKVRTFFAAITGILAVYLILSTITIVWLNRTLTSTTTYVNTVAPLVTKPAIQNFVAQKVTDQLLSNAPIQDLATSLLPASELQANQTTDQLKGLLRPVINSSVLQIVRSPSFATLWRDTNQTAHAALVAQLNSNSNSGQLTLDLSPAINGVIAELKTTQLGSLANKLTPNSGTGKLSIKNNGVTHAHHYYKLFQTGTVAIVVAAILAAALSIWLAVHHAKTARRILFVVGILAILQAIVLEVPVFITFKGPNKVTQDAVIAIAHALSRYLQLADIVVGVLCLLAIISSKLYTKYRH